MSDIRIGCCCIGYISLPLVRLLLHRKAISNTLLLENCPPPEWTRGESRLCVSLTRQVCKECVPCAKPRKLFCATGSLFWLPASCCSSHCCCRPSTSVFP